MINIAGQLVVQESTGIFTGKFEQSHLHHGHGYGRIARCDKLLGSIAKIVDAAVDNTGTLRA